MEKDNSPILISRTDSIGDVILTLPLCGFLKEIFPARPLFFLASAYTLPLLECCRHIDKILNWDEIKQQSFTQQVAFLRSFEIGAVIHVFPRLPIAKLCFRAGLPIRIGTSRRLYHLLYCNKWVNLSRKNSGLHEAELNLRLSIPLTRRLPERPLWRYYSLESPKTTANALLQALRENRRPKIIVHPGSRGSAPNWPLPYWRELIEGLLQAGYQVLLTGSLSEAESFSVWLKELPEEVYNLMGKFTLKELIECINLCDLLVAASTGPLHIAAALGKPVFGLYVPLKPLYPKRWAPLGPKAHYWVAETNCRNCNIAECRCMLALAPTQALVQIQKILPLKS
jgi:ADP-heptose:LPS heptosyltransferase